MRCMFLGEILLIHPDQEIIFIICPCHLPRGMAGAGKCLAPGRRVDGVSEFSRLVAADSDVELRRQSRILHQLS